MQYLLKSIEFLKNNKDAFLALGVFIAAIASLLAAYLSSRAQRKNSIGNLRAAWVESLRNDIAIYMELLPHMLARNNLDAGKTRQYYMIFNRIRLQLNEKNLSHKRIVHVMKKLSCAITDENHKFELNELDDELRKATQAVLSFEWERAAKGEL